MDNEFDKIWVGLAKIGRCDSIGSIEYHRVREEFSKMPNGGDIKSFITQRANIPPKRFCYYIPIDSFIKDRGFRVSIVTENQPGHQPTGDWPYEAKLGQKLPWFWGMEYELAKELCSRSNEELGLSEADVLEIINSSMK